MALLTLQAHLRQQRSRLVTLTGPAGVGKSRLAAAAVLDGSARVGTVVRVDLHQVRTAGELDRALGSTAAVHGTGSREGRDGVSEALRADHPLLVLDGCEAARDIVAVRVQELLSRHPGLRVLTTGRRRLGVYGERLIPVDPLPVPPPTAYRAQSVGELLERPSAVLFVDRARRADPSFALVGGNCPAVAEICHRLDGLPAALEIAADRLRLMHVNTLLDYVREGHRIIGADHPGLPPRQRSLDELIGGSVRLLSEPQREVLLRLATAVGGSGFDAFEGELGLGPAPAEADLEALVDLNLLVTRHKGGRTRYVLLETVRQYCLAQLRASGRLSTARRDQADCLLSLVRRAEPHLIGPDAPHWIRSLDAEIDNLDGAFGWLHKSGSRGAEAASYGSLALSRYWLAQGRLVQGRRWLREALDVLGPASEHRALASAAEAADGMLAYVYGDLRGAVDSSGRAFAAYRAAGDTKRARIAAVQQSAARRRVNGLRDEETADQLVEDVIAEEPGSGSEQAALALTVASVHASPECAERMLNAAELAFVRAQDGWGRGFVQVLRSARAEARGGHALGESLLREGIALLKGVGERLVLPAALAMHARLLWGHMPDQRRRAVRLLAAGTAVIDETGARLPGMEIPPGTLVEEAPEELGFPLYESLWREGRMLSPDAAAQEALSAPMLPEDPPAVVFTQGAELTARQQEVSALVAAGLTNRQIAKRLGLSEWTVINHMRQIMRKLEAPSRVHVAQWVLRQEELAQA